MMVILLKGESNTNQLLWSCVIVICFRYHGALQLQQIIKQMIVLGSQG
jgi:hypothetical protein